MVIYMNPFLWGMRRKPHYRPSQNTSSLISELNKKYDLDMEVGEVIDTLWYFRDLKHDRISKLKNFEFQLYGENLEKSNLEKVKNYADDFRLKFEHRNQFDSLKIFVKYDSLIYKTKMK